MEDFFVKLLVAVKNAEESNDPRRLRTFEYAKTRLFSDDRPVMRKIILSKYHVSELRQLLLLEGITTAHLMPTLDNVAKTSLRLSIDAAKS